MCSISREPHRDDLTTCTAVAPDFVFTVRAYGTGPLYGRPGRARAATRQPASLPGNSRSRTLVTRAGTPPRGAVRHRAGPGENSYAWIMTLADGKVIDGTAFYDSISFNDLWARVQPGRTR